MKIIKYKKKGSNKYNLELDNGKSIILYEDVILKYNLLLKKELDVNDLIEVDKYNQECDVYYVALNSIKNRYKSTYELKMTLLKKEYPEDLVDKALDKLIKQGYLNDRSYTKSFINNRIITSNKGPLFIEKELLDKKVDISIIKEEIIVFDEKLQKEKINKIINKDIKTNRTKGGVILKQKIYNNLKMLGYDISLINSEISNYSFENDKELAKKEYDKLYRKYSKKYSGKELELKIKEKLYLKGLKYEEE